jgi:hypothetical protein
MMLIMIAYNSASLDQSVLTMKRRPNAGIASSLYSSVRDRRVYQDPIQTKAFYSPLLHTITVRRSFLSSIGHFLTSYKCPFVDQCLYRAMMFGMLLCSS